MKLRDDELIEIAEDLIDQWGKFILKYVEDKKIGDLDPHQSSIFLNTVYTNIVASHFYSLHILHGDDYHSLCRRLNEILLTNFDELEQSRKLQE